MVQNDELGKLLHENDDVPRKSRLDDEGLASDSDALAPSDRPIGGVGLDAGHREDD